MVVRSAIFILMLLMVSCAKRSSPGGRSGGVDGGGGDLRLHTEEEAIREAEEVWDFLKQTRPDNPLQVAYDYLWGKIYANKADYNRGRPLTPSEDRVWEILNKIYDGSPATGEGWDGYSDNKLTKRLKDKKLNLLKTGLCKGPAHGGHIASVSKLDWSGEVCISIYEVRKMPHSGIRSTPLIALFAHEIVHLAGYGEADGKLVQEFFVTNMPALMRLRGDEAKIKFAAKAERGLQVWRKTITYGRIDAEHFAGLKEMAGQLSEIRVGVPKRHKGDVYIPHPELLRDIWESTLQLEKDYESFAEKMESALKRNRRLRMDEAALLELRELALRVVRIYPVIMKYLFSSEIPGVLLPHELDSPNPNEGPPNEAEVLEKTNPAFLKPAKT